MTYRYGITRETGTKQGMPTALSQEGQALRVRSPQIQWLLIELLLTKVRRRLPYDNLTAREKKN